MELEANKWRTQGHDLPQFAFAVIQLCQSLETSTLTHSFCQGSEELIERRRNSKNTTKTHSPRTLPCMSKQGFAVSN